MHVFIRWLPSLLWMAVIFYLSSRTGEDVGGWLDIVRRFVPMMEGFDWGHFAAYFILAWTYLWAWRPKRLSLGVKLAVILLCVLYGVTDEYHQSFVPGRTPDLKDIRNDAIGAALAMLLLYIPFVRRWYGRLSGAKYY
ncbi:MULTISPECIES: VanZ family protein [Paenibacillus]|uniref:VanZ-like protein n=1 Tax=Paenibacillus naphthalenovorans TaxID=162209 RepID=A0A0U2UE51_9BACL|nr:MULTISPECIES: VanZ family protein [Paenibacillus]ALS21516.1 VanZ-like protein [Paenibacillus naphthalenovorans]NTZ18323.1 hypothetical protein [Paenibacillus sp. JMULE4]SDI76098.1 VanZ like family protein [Paenibacillus naphthalenovorans]